MENHKIRVAITQGDTNGTGFELIFKTFSEPEMLELCTPIIYGSPKVAAYHSKALATECQFTIIKNAHDAHDGKLNLLACTDEDIKVEIGQSTAESSMAAIKALDKALADGRNGLYDVLVCNPASQQPFSLHDMKFSSHDSFIETSIGEGNRTLPLHICNNVRIVIANDSNMERAIKELTVESLQQKVRTLHDSLRRDFFISTPRIAVLALNPVEGKEEKEVIAPVVATLAAERINVFGPYQAETFFADRLHEQFDGIIAMHHDQGMIPIKMLSNFNGIRFIANLPIVCTMPDTDEQLSIAGKNLANEEFLRNAIYMAIDVFRHRAEYDEPMRNPLPKLYHERPDSGEKLRFSIPKKKEEQ